jgi:hypothetical protein
MYRIGKRLGRTGLFWDTFSNEMNTRAKRKHHPQGV